MAVHYHLGKFPPENLDWPRLAPLLAKANTAIARYDALMSASPSASLMISPLATQEAVLSSKIEGTTVTLSEALQIKAGADTEFSQTLRDDAEEVWNYCEALTFASSEIRERPLSLHLLRETHKLLMRGVRGRDKTPGQFRTLQNWIGPRGRGIEQASFVPIPQEHLMSGLESWIQYVNGNSVPDYLVQLAVIHLEFEAIHPFMDGNGRLGRMIVPLFLYERKMLRWPYFYMSGYLETHRDQYMETMRDVSRNGTWDDWCVFFITGLIEQANSSLATVERISSFYGQMKLKLVEKTHSRYAGHTMDFLFQNPVFHAPQFLTESGIPSRTARRILDKLTSGGSPFLQTVRKGSGRAAAIFAFPELLNIVEEKTVL